jgi:hypothetical protein
MPTTAAVDDEELEEKQHHVRMSNGLAYCAIVALVAGMASITVLATLLTIVWTDKWPGNACLDGSNRMFRALLVHEHTARAAGNQPFYSIVSTNDQAEQLVTDEREVARLYICELLLQGRHGAIEAYLLWGKGKRRYATALFYRDREDCKDDLAELCRPSTAANLVARDLARYRPRDNASRE